MGYYCFRVTATEFKVIFASPRSSGIAYRCLPHGEVDNEVDHSVGGSVAYRSEPVGRVWELLTGSYARDESTGAV